VEILNLNFYNIFLKERRLMEEFNFSDSEVELEVLPQKATPLKHEMIEVKNDTFK